MKKSLAIFIAIILLTAFLRIFKLGNIPAGFANDEAAITYQAYSVLSTGNDTWGNYLPLLSFKDFGEYLPPFAVYAQILFLKFLGLNELSARLPFALTGIVSVGALYVLTKSLFNKKRYVIRMLDTLKRPKYVKGPFNIR